VSRLCEVPPPDREVLGAQDAAGEDDRDPLSRHVVFEQRGERRARRLHQRPERVGSRASSEFPLGWRHAEAGKRAAQGLRWTPHVLITYEISRYQPAVRISSSSWSGGHCPASRAQSLSETLSVTSMATVT
jgi:hypothetical protein